MVSVPLTHSRDPKELYGVLSVSSRRPSSPLVDQDAGSGTRVILEALNQFCFGRLVARQRPRARPAAVELDTPSRGTVG